MSPKSFILRIFLKHNVRDVRDWHMSLGNLARSFPSWLNIEVVSDESLSTHRQIITLRRKFFGRERRMICHFDYARNGAYLKISLKNRKFVYCNFKIEFRDQNTDSCELVEKIDYELRFSWFFGRIRRALMNRIFKKFFVHKHAVMLHDLEFLRKGGKVMPQRVLVAGASGLIGSALVSFLQSLGHDVWQMKHNATGAVGSKVIVAELEKGVVDPTLFEGFDSIVNLCGSSMTRRWTAAAKEDVMLSRYETTRRLVQIISGLQSPPKTFLSASAVGYYGNCGSALVDEDKAKGAKSFLSEVCVAWENACALLKKRGIRVVNLRFGIVLSMRGGALTKLVPLFKWGFGGKLGDGLQYMSWISIEDAVGAIYHAMIHPEVFGPVNIVSPNPVTNKEFTHILARSLHRPSLLPAPKFFLRMIKGQMADEMLLSSVKVEPRRLIESNYRFRYPFLRDALEDLIF